MSGFGNTGSFPFDLSKSSKVTSPIANPTASIELELSRSIKSYRPPPANALPSPGPPKLQKRIPCNRRDLEQLKNQLKQMDRSPWIE